MWFLALIAAAGLVWWLLEHDKHAEAKKRAQQASDIKGVYEQQGLAIRQSDIEAILDTKYLETTHRDVLDRAIQYTLSLEKSGRSTIGISEYATAKLRRLAAEHGGIAIDEDIRLVLQEKITGDDLIRRSVDRARQEGASSELTQFAMKVRALREIHDGKVQPNSGSFLVRRQE